MIVLSRFHWNVIVLFSHMAEAAPLGDKYWQPGNIFEGHMDPSIGWIRAEAIFPLKNPGILSILGFIGGYFSSPA